MGAQYGCATNHQCKNNKCVARVGVGAPTERPTADRDPNRTGRNDDAHLERVRVRARRHRDD